MDGINGRPWSKVCDWPYHACIVQQSHPEERKQSKMVSSSSRETSHAVSKEFRADQDLTFLSQNLESVSNLGFAVSVNGYREKSEFCYGMSPVSSKSTIFWCCCNPLKNKGSTCSVKFWRKALLMITGSMKTVSVSSFESTANQTISSPVSGNCSQKPSLYPELSSLQRSSTLDKYVYCNHHMERYPWWTQSA